MRLRKTASLVLSVLVLSVGLTVAAASPASAAAPLCNTFVNHFAGVYKWSVPVYRNAAGNNEPKCVMGAAYNSNGSHVSVLQFTLRNCYGQNIAVDGDFGPATAAALANAQRFHGVNDDGVYGPMTASVLAWDSNPNGRFFPQC